MNHHEYKNSGRTSSTERASRTTSAIELRNQRRSEMLHKRRVTGTARGPDSYGISVMAEKVNAAELDRIAEGAAEFRRLLSAEKTPPIDNVVNTGLVPRFAKLLDPQNPLYLAPGADKKAVAKIMLESAWVLTNIASGTTKHTMSIIQAGAVPYLVALLQAPDEELQDQAVWALGNIAGDCEDARDHVIGAGATDPLLHLAARLIFAQSTNLQLMRNLSWAISNLNRGRSPAPTDAHMYKCLEVIVKLTESQDPDVVTDAYWALSYICDARSSSIDMVLATPVVQRAIDGLRLLQQGKGVAGQGLQERIAEAALSPIIRMLGNIVTGDDRQTDFIIALGLLLVLKAIYQYPCDTRKSSRIRKEICWLISNITAGTPAQIDHVIEAGFLEVLVQALRFGEQYIRTEACWAVCNATSQVETHPHQAMRVFKAGCIPALAEFVQSVQKDAKMVTLVLETIGNLLVYGENESLGAENAVAEEMEEYGLLDIVEGLQDSESDSVAEKAEAIIRTFFIG